MNKNYVKFILTINKNKRKFLINIKIFIYEKDKIGKKKLVQKNT